MAPRTKHKKSSSEIKNENWVNTKWRPAMSWLYMITCSCDFILFPIFWAILQTTSGIPVTQWSPITLHGAGLYHLAMGAVLGVAAWSRGQEKMAGVAGNIPWNNTARGFGAPNYGYNNSPYQAFSEYQPTQTIPQRQLSAKSRRIIPDVDPGDADHIHRVDPEARG
jgi:hypothetical protein